MRELIALGTGSFVAFGVFSLPAGWLADRWSRRNMMVLFHVGCGLSLAAAGLAPNLTVLAVALTSLGIFAAIYHPVGMPMLVAAATSRGRTLAFNGVCGNLGAALAAGITASLIELLGWRGAFLVPAALLLATGAIYPWLVPDDRSRAAGRNAAPDVPLTAARAAVLFGLFVIVALTAGLVLQTMSVALPKIVDERLGIDVPLFWVGSLATAVFMCGAIAQLAVGRLVERFPMHLSVRGWSRCCSSAAWCGPPGQRRCAARRARADHGGDLRAGDGQRSGHRPLHRGCLARPGLCGALFPHLRGVGRRGVGDLVPVRPRRLRSRAVVDRLHRLRPGRGVPGDRLPGQ